MILNRSMIFRLVKTGAKARGRPPDRKERSENLFARCCELFASEMPEKMLFAAAGCRQGVGRGRENGFLN